ncbi:hypothetical protein [Ekhidna sp.]|uniref:hypothetical protein n=1 Tax=Ekhidna sp. TaxID=2608089 RepID=UPI0032996F07
MKYRVIVFSLLLSICLVISGQSFEKQRAQFIAFNVGFNGLVGGVGSWINKSENQDFWNAFAKGFYKGAIGGAVSHVGFSLTSQIRTKRNIAYAWPARLVNSFGASIVQNAASNNRMLENLHFNLFVSRLDYYPYSKKFQARLFTSSIYGIIVTSRDAKLDLMKSLQSGIIYFDSNQNFRSSLVEGAATGQVSSVGMRSDIFTSDQEYYDVFAHEMAHIMQFDRKVAGNAFMIRVDKKAKEKFTIYHKLSKYIYFDLNGPIFFFAYKFQDNRHNCNFFEQEAEHYSGRRYYGCN